MAVFIYCYSVISERVREDFSSDTHEEDTEKYHLPLFDLRDNKTLKSILLK